MEATENWVVIIRGKAEGQDVRVALDFEDSQALLAPLNIVVGRSFINQLLDLIKNREQWLLKTVIEEVRTPQNNTLPANVPLFVVISKSSPRGLSAGALFIIEDVALQFENVVEGGQDTTNSNLNLTKRFILAGLSPVGFAAACAEDTRLFTRFISRLLKRPEAFEEVSLLLPRHYPGFEGND